MASKNLLDDKRVLIVDDEIDVLDTLEELLQWVSFDKLESPSGNRIYFVRNGKQKLIRDYRRGGLDVL